MGGDAKNHKGKAKCKAIDIGKKTIFVHGVIHIFYPCCFVAKD
tara:strand:+ start:61 stop:189 length:129 start_codon:yes stop_codon:yes gene_type:complete